MSVFNYYDVYFINKEDKTTVNNLNDVIFNSTDFIYSNLESYEPDSNFQYFAEISSFDDESKCFFGSIMKINKSSKYYVKTNRHKLVNLSKKISEKGITSSEFIANFVFIVYENKLTFLMESGYQTPGVGILKKIIDNSDPLYKIIFEISKTKQNEDVLKSLLKRQMKCFKLHTDDFDVRNLDCPIDKLKHLFKDSGVTSLNLECKVRIKGHDLLDWLFGNNDIDILRQSDIISQINRLQLLTEDNQNVRVSDEFVHEKIEFDDHNIILNESQINELVDKIKEFENKRDE